MEAPEKIWMNDDWVHQFDVKEFMGEDSVEYTRTDAFINKACEWLSNRVNDYIINDKYILPNGKMSRDWLKIKSDMFDDFRKYMKGE